MFLYSSIYFVRNFHGVLLRLHLHVDGSFFNGMIILVPVAVLDFDGIKTYLAR